MVETKEKTERKTGLALLVSLALAAGVLIFLSWLAEEVMEGDTRLFDEAVRTTVNGYAGPRLTDAMRAVTYLGSTVVVTSLSVCAVVALYLTKKRRAAFLLLVTMAGAAILNVTLKLSFHRVRPEPFFGVATPASYSFPSGHALLSCCLFGTLAVLVGRRAERPAVRAAVWAVAALVVALVGFSRIYLGVHYPSDVVAGYAAAILWVTSVGLADELLRRRGVASIRQ